MTEGPSASLQRRGCQPRLVPHRVRGLAHLSHSPIRPGYRTRSPSRIRHSPRPQSPSRENSPSSGRASTRDLEHQYPRARSHSRAGSSLSAAPVPAPRAHRGCSEFRGRTRSSTPANGRKRPSSSPSQK